MEIFAEHKDANIPTQIELGEYGWMYSAVLILICTPISSVSGLVPYPRAEGSRYCESEAQDLQVRFDGQTRGVLACCFILVVGISAYIM